MCDVSASSLCCGICHESTASAFDPLVHPCKCHTRSVHTTCLQRWNLKRPRAKKMHCCEVCQTPYWGNRFVWYGMMTGVWLVQFLQMLSLRKTWQNVYYVRYDWFILIYVVVWCALTGDTIYSWAVGATTTGGLVCQWVGVRQTHCILVRPPLSNIYKWNRPKRICAVGT